MLHRCQRARTLLQELIHDCRSIDLVDFAFADVELQYSPANAQRHVLQGWLLRPSFLQKDKSNSDEPDKSQPARNWDQNSGTAR